jgi:hypothetical protein
MNAKKPSEHPPGARFSKLLFDELRRRDIAIGEGPAAALYEALCRFFDEHLRSAGTEPPAPLADAPAGRNVLGYYGKLGCGWQISRYNFAECRWESVRPFLGTPDEWRELPEVPK